MSHEKGNQFLLVNSLAKAMILASLRCIMEHPSLLSTGLPEIQVSSTGIVDHPIRNLKHLQYRFLGEKHPIYMIGMQDTKMHHQIFLMIGRGRMQRGSY